MTETPHNSENLAAGRTTSVVTSAGTTTLAYDYEGRISTITYPSSATNSFTYNGLDTRVGMVDSAGTTTYRRDGDDVLSPVLEAGGTKFTPGISRRTGTTSYFYHQDCMGSAVRQTNSTQGSLTSRQYDAFGNVAYEGGTWVGPFGFVGGEDYQEDSDSGLQLLGHRYYDPSTSRFLTRDPIKDGLLPEQSHALD
jgi:RHS repeat-associated protein